MGHFLESCLYVAGSEFDSAAGVSQESGGEGFLEGVEHGKFNAIVGGDSADVQVGDTFFAKEIGESGALLVAIVVEATVAIYRGIGSFSKDSVDASSVESGCKTSTVCSLHAMGGPEHLRKSGEFDGVTDLFVGMIRGEAAVVSRMPVLRGNDEVVVREEFVDEGDEFVAARHAKRSAREEIILKVNDEECFHE